MAQKKKARKKKTKVVKKRKKAAGKPVKKKAKGKKKKAAGPALPAGKIVGTVTHYFPHVQAAVIKLKKPLSVGNTIRIKGKTTDFEQKVESMQIDHVPIQAAKKGDEIGLRVTSRVREHDIVVLPS